MATAPSKAPSTTLGTLTIGGEQEPGAGSYPVHNPARPAEIVGHAPAADAGQLDAAVAAASSWPVSAAGAWPTISAGRAGLYTG